MTRQEFELLCQPLSPEEALEELGELKAGYDETYQLDTSFIAITASIGILSRLIESFDESPSVRAARIMF